MASFMSINELFPVIFSNGRTAQAIEVKDPLELPKTLKTLGFISLNPTLVLVGGASKMSESDLNYLQKIFENVIAPLAETLNLIVFDGGTDAGIMKLMGQARAKIQASFPLIGVVAVGTVNLPDATFIDQDRALLDANHTHFIFVPGQNWGDESPWLAHIPSLLSQGLPSVTLVINGGEITWQDVTNSIQQGRPTLILAGSGRTADKIADALRGKIKDTRTEVLNLSGLLQIVNMYQDIDNLKQIIAQWLS